MWLELFQDRERGDQPLKNCTLGSVWCVCLCVCLCIFAIGMKGGSTCREETSMVEKKVSVHNENLCFGIEKKILAEKMNSFLIEYLFSYENSYNGHYLWTNVILSNVYFI